MADSLCYINISRLSYIKIDYYHHAGSALTGRLVTYQGEGLGRLALWDKQDLKVMYHLPVTGGSQPKNSTKLDER